MKKILVPVDFSKTSQDALKVAVNICNQTQCDLIGIHMLGGNESILPQTTENNIEESIFLLKQAEQNFNQLYESISLDKELNFIPIIKKKKDFNNLSKIAIENGVDLIVMGTEGSHGWDEFIKGSNSQKVVRHSDIPILTIKPNISIQGKSLVYLSDFKEESISGFDKLSPIFRALELQVLPLCIVVPDVFKYTADIYEDFGYFLNKIKDNMDLNISDLHIENAFSIEDGVNAFCRREKSNIIAINTHGYTGLQHFFNGSITESLVNHSKLPVLSAKI